MIEGFALQLKVGEDYNESLKASLVTVEEHSVFISEFILEVQAYKKELKVITLQASVFVR